MPNPLKKNLLVKMQKQQPIPLNTPLLLPSADSTAAVVSELGQILADKLGYNFYDKEIIEMTAGTTGYSSNYVGEHQESLILTACFMI